MKNKYIETIGRMMIISILMVLIINWQLEINNLLGWNFFVVISIILLVWAFNGIQNSEKEMEK